MATRTARVLIAKPGLDGHDRGARVVASALRDAGFEVIYTGLRASVDAIAAAAIQEDVDVVGLSVLSGAHESICRRLLAELAQRGADIPVIVGGIVPDADRRKLLEMGVKRVFGPETPLDEVVRSVTELAGTGPAEELESSVGVRGLDHLAICVSDLEEATRFWEKLLGSKPIHREHVPEQKTEAVFFDFGGGTALELVAPRDGNPGLGSFLKRRGPGLHHLAIEVESVERGLAALVRAGLQPIDSHPRPGARGHRVAFLHPRSTGGVLLELVEHKDEHREEAARGDGKGEGKNVEPEEARAG